MKAVPGRAGRRVVDAPPSRVLSRSPSPTVASSYGTPPPPSPLPDTYLMTREAAAAAAAPARRQMHSAS